MLDILLYFLYTYYNKRGEEEMETVKKDDNWIPANNRTEVPFKTRTGKTLLYCYQPSTGKHAYLDYDNDIILTDEEARLALAMW